MSLLKSFNSTKAASHLFNKSLVDNKSFAVYPHSVNSWNTKTSTCLFNASKIFFLISSRLFEIFPTLILMVAAAILTNPKISDCLPFSSLTIFEV